MKYLLLITCLYSMASFGNVNKSEGQEAGNGGFIDDLISSEMNERKTLTVDDVNKLVELFGKNLVSKVVRPAINSFINNDHDELSKLNLIKNIFVDNRELLNNEFILTRLKVGQCNGATTCTGDNNFDDIYIDLDAINNSAFGVSFSELAGLIAHEYLHHFMSEIPTHDDYALSRYIKNSILDSSYIVVKFEMKDLIYEEDGKRHIFHDYGFNHGGRRLARLFCQFKGFSDVYEYTGNNIWSNEVRNYFNISIVDGNKYKLRIFNFKLAPDGKVILKKGILKRGGITNRLNGGYFLYTFTSISCSK